MFYSVPTNRNKDSNSENRIKLRIRDITPLLKGRRPRWPL
jgi:hypothetical protein